MKEENKIDIEAILGQPFYPHECGGMIDCVTHKDAINAVKEAIRQTVPKILKMAAEKAMIEEHIPEDEQDDYDGNMIVISGGRIRDEHLVMVHKKSITDQSEEIIKQLI